MVEVVTWYGKFIDSLTDQALNVAIDQTKGNIKGAKKALDKKSYQETLDALTTEHKARFNPPKKKSNG